MGGRNPICINCGFEVRTDRKLQGRAGKLRDILVESGLPVICSVCEPMSNWHRVETIKEANVLGGKG